MMSAEIFFLFLGSVLIVVGMIALVERLVMASRRSGLLSYVSHMQTHSGVAITVLTPSGDLALFIGAFSKWSRCPSGELVTPEHAAQLAEFHTRLLWAAPLMDEMDSIDPAALRSSALKAGSPAAVKGVT